MNVTEVDKAYLAGFFDGEGCVGYYDAAKSYSHRPAYFHASVSVCNTDPRAILWIKKITGMGKSKIIRFTDGKRRVAYQWQIGKKADILLFLHTIRPYLRVKDTQVDVLLAHLATEDAYTKKHGSVTPEIVESRQHVADQLKKMKRMVFSEGVETRHVESAIH
jgi:hypothetical protein